ncbi:MAG: hypothetical protein F6J93_33140 [Oscillatoria sp. SIO1A7]|nr:hypothetical protein [Oscillatoria sp. SIO1A7]
MGCREEGGGSVARRASGFPTFYILHPALHPALHPTPYTLHPSYAQFPLSAIQW